MADVTACPRVEPHDCEQCDCLRYRWNGAPSALRSDPPSTCRCGHPAYRHRFRVPSKDAGDDSA